MLLPCFFCDMILTAIDLDTLDLYSYLETKEDIEYWMAIKDNPSLCFRLINGSVSYFRAFYESPKSFYLASITTSDYINKDDIEELYLPIPKISEIKFDINLISKEAQFADTSAVYLDCLTDDNKRKIFSKYLELYSKERQNE